MAEATAYGCGGVQIGHSARDRRLSYTTQMRCLAKRRNGCVARIVRLGGYAIALSHEPIERWSARGKRSYKTLQAA